MNSKQTAKDNDLLFVTYAPVQTLFILSFSGAVTKCFSNYAAQILLLLMKKCSRDPISVEAVLEC